MNTDPENENCLGFFINENLKLELINESHAQEVYNLTDKNREYLRVWLPWVDSTNSVSDTSDFIKISKEQFDNNNGFQLIIKYNNEVAGLLGLHYLNLPHKHTEIGYWIAENYSDKGLVTISCKALIDHCFDVMNLNRVVIKCATDNLKSRKIPEKLRFKKEGVLRQEIFMNGKFVDHVLYSVLREEWISK